MKQRFGERVVTGRQRDECVDLTRRQEKSVTSLFRVVPHPLPTTCLFARLRPPLDFLSTRIPLRRSWTCSKPWTSCCLCVVTEFCLKFLLLNPLQANNSLPSSGSLDDHLRFLSTLRNTRDTVAQKQSAISHDLHSAHETTKLQELRLTHATNTLNALEDVIGEVRARFRARGIPLYPPKSWQKISDTEPATTSPSTVITSNPSAVEEVSVSFPCKCHF